MIGRRRDEETLNLLKKSLSRRHRRIKTTKRVKRKIKEHIKTPKNQRETKINTSHQHGGSSASSKRPKLSNFLDLLREKLSSGQLRMLNDLYLLMQTISIVMKCASLQLMKRLIGKDDDMANIIVAQLLYLDVVDPTKLIQVGNISASKRRVVRLSGGSMNHCKKK